MRASRAGSGGQVVSIGGASGFWGESAAGIPALVERGNLDFLVFDYLAEITMSLLARARASDESMGYAPDFISHALEPNLEALQKNGIRVLSNAGGMNPRACADRIRTLLDEAGLGWKVGVVEGDDLCDRADHFVGAEEMFSGAAFPEIWRIASINAYLGAFPIAAALDAGADIVICGRVVDSALTLGACIHHFGWSADALDKLACGSLAGHLLECSTQATGGNFTDWEKIADDLGNIGHPIVDMQADGSFSLRKTPGSGGLVSRATVGEQLLYEIEDPQAYVLPDVTCDFSDVVIEEDGDNQVRVHGAKGTAPPENYKICATYNDGFRGGNLLIFCGIGAAGKARRYAQSVVDRSNRILAIAGQPALHDAQIEVIGDESHFGKGARTAATREVAVKVAARHEDSAGINVLLREMVGGALAAPPGLTMFSAGGRPKPSPVIRLFSFLLPKTDVHAVVRVDDQDVDIPANASTADDSHILDRPEVPSVPDSPGALMDVPLVRVAWARSGDKGNRANIGVMARHPDLLPWIGQSMTEERVADAFEHFLEGRVERFYLPGLHALNFVLHDVLGGGGIASLRNDPQGKTYGQILLAQDVQVPAELMESLGL